MHNVANLRYEEFKTIFPMIRIIARVTCRYILFQSAALNWG